MTTLFTCNEYDKFNFQKSLLCSLLHLHLHSIPTYFYLAQEHLFIIFYEYPAKLFFRTNFDEKFQTESHCGASSGTAEGVGQWRHDSTIFWLFNPIPIGCVCVGGGHITLTK